MKGDMNYQQAAKLRAERSLDKALEEINKAIQLNEEVADYFAERGVILFHLDQKHAAVKDMERALKLEPTNPFRYSSRAYMFESIGQTEAAIEDYKKAIELDPEDAVAHNNLGLLEEKLGYKVSSKKHFEKADQFAEKSIGRTELQRGVEPSGGIDVTESIPEKETSKKTSTWKIILNVFKDSSTRKEFIKFVKNGFRVKKEGE